MNGTDPTDLDTLRAEEARRHDRLAGDGAGASGAVMSEGKEQGGITSGEAPTFVDAKGRTRWHRNDEVAQRVRELGEVLIIGGYPEAHAARYARLAHTISRLPDSIDELAETGRLESIAGVGGVITGYLESIIRTGTSEKFVDAQYGPPAPESVLELTAIDGLGAKTARTLYREHGIDGRDALAVALADARLADIKGIGPKLLATIERTLTDPP